MGVFKSVLPKLWSSRGERGDENGSMKGPIRVKRDTISALPSSPARWLVHRSGLWTRRSALKPWA